VPDTYDTGIDPRLQSWASALSLCDDWGCGESCSGCHSHCSAFSLALVRELSRRPSVSSPRSALTEIARCVLYPGTPTRAGLKGAAGSAVSPEIGDFWDDDELRSSNHPDDARTARSEATEDRSESRDPEPAGAFDRSSPALSPKNAPYQIDNHA